MINNDNKTEYKILILDVDLQFPSNILNRSIIIKEKLFFDY